MPSKSLKVSVNMTADQVEDAIVFLSDRYLKATKAGCRVVQTPTEFCLVDLCKPLIECWISEKSNYAKGKITLLFRSGSLSDEADMIIYAPAQGDRFLYAKPQEPNSISDDQLSLPFESGEGENHRVASPASHPLQQLIERQASLDEKLNQLLESRNISNATDSPQAEESTPSATSTSSYMPHQHLSAIPEHAFDDLVHRLNEAFTQKIRDSLTSALQPLHHRITELQDQIADLSERIDELEDIGLDDEPLIPQSQKEWLERIEQCWGTVGDYERYNATYREANAETPLHDPPDWVALCELDWARELCPTLATLYALIHRPDGMGYEGADILQQFGRHLDAKTGDTYYIYRHNGFTPMEAFQQIINSPDYSWLPELQKLWRCLEKSDHEIFKLFGWEEESIAALHSVVTQTQQHQRSGYSWDYRQPWQTAASTPSLKEHRATLNLGPFTPITLEAVKRAYREAMKTAHPDSGGTTEYAQRVNEAYEAVMQYYFPEVVKKS
jgi:hypothetical protein